MTTLISTPATQRACDTLLSNLELRLKLKQYCDRSINSELDWIADKIIEDPTEHWVLDCCERFYNINAYHFGLRHENTVCALLKYAFFHLYKKNIQIAICLFKDGYQRNVSQYGKYSKQAVFVLETLVDVYKDNKMQDQYEESLLSLYFVYKRLYLDEHPKTKEAKSKFFDHSKDWSDVTEKYKIFNKAESIAIHLPEAQRLGIFKSEIVTYRKNLFKEFAHCPQSIENQKVMIEKFMKKFNVTYDAFNAYLVDHREYPSSHCTSMVFTLDEQVLFCQYVTESGWWVYNEAETLKVAAAVANNETVELGEDRRFAGCFVDPKNGITEQSVFTRASSHRYDILVSDCLAPKFNDDTETVFGDFYTPL